MLTKKIEYKDMYNQELKERFLHECYHTEESRKVVANYFYVSYLTENDVLNKDLSAMSEEELASVIKSLDLKTIYSVKNAISYFKNYISWAIKNGERKNMINPLSNVDDEFCKKLINNSDASYWSKEFIIEDVIPNIEDAQDKALIMLIFEGVYGKQLSEIRYLKWSDIDKETKIATVYNNEGTKERKIEISDELIDILRLAESSATYTNVYGKKFDLVDTDYIFRKTTRGKSSENENEPIKQIQLLNRLSKIQEALGIPRFKPNNIYKSGMLYTYYQELLRKNDGKLDFNYANRNKDLKKNEVENAIAEKYNWTLLVSKRGYTFYNTSNYRKSFLNIENVLDIYSPSTSSVKG